MQEQPVCPSVCPSRLWTLNKINKLIFKIFSPLSSHTILVYPHQTSRQYFDGDPLMVGIECRWDRQKMRFLTNISLPDRWLLQCKQQLRRRPCSLPHRRRCISKSLFITTSMDNDDKETRAEQIWIVSSHKSEAELVLNILYCWSYWQTQSIAQPLCGSRATCGYCWDQWQWQITLVVGTVS